MSAAPARQIGPLPLIERALGPCGARRARGLNRAGARRPLTYALLGGGLWLFVLASGIHATIAGVVGVTLLRSAGPVGREND